MTINDPFGLSEESCAELAKGFLLLQGLESAVQDPDQLDVAAFCLVERTVAAAGITEMELARAAKDFSLPDSDFELKAKAWGLIPILHRLGEQEAAWTAFAAARVHRRTLTDY